MVAHTSTTSPQTGAHDDVTKIRFGTDGWRAAIAEDYTFHNVRRCARGVAEHLHETGAADRGVVVCHDRRFASEHFARACVEVLAAHEIRSYVPPEAVPTQVGSFFTRELGATYSCRIDGGAVAGDHSRRLQPPHPLRHGGGREVHPLAERVVRQPRVGLQRVEQPPVELVQLERS
jgi:phosphoglucomutase